jgi:TRAP-type C4-dicarboxylate transport system permease large subunit
LVALLAATGAQTETIPPSIVLITIGSVTACRLPRLFNGGMVPAVVLGVMLCAVVWWRYRKEDLSGIKAPLAREIRQFLLIALRRCCFVRHPRRRGGKMSPPRPRFVDQRHRVFGARGLFI